MFEYLSMGGRHEKMRDRERDGDGEREREREKKEI